MLCYIGLYHVRLYEIDIVLRYIILYCIELFLYQTISGSTPNEDSASKTPGAPPGWRSPPSGGPGGKPVPAHTSYVELQCY